MELSGVAEQRLWFQSTLLEYLISFTLLLWSVTSRLYKAYTQEFAYTRDAQRGTVVLQFSIILLRCPIPP